jgi:hypothetical protein
MFTKVAQTLTILAVATLLFVNTSKAANTTEKVTTVNPIELKVIAKDAVQITTNIIAANVNEYFELERSFDNITFTTVTVIFAGTEAENMANPLVLKNRIKEDAKVVYYRIKKISNEVVTYSSISSVTLSK